MWIKPCSLRSQRFIHGELNATTKAFVIGLIGHTHRHLTPFAIAVVSPSSPLSTRAITRYRAIAPTRGREVAPRRAPFCPAANGRTRGARNRTLAYSGGEAGAGAASLRRAGGGSSDGQKGRNPLLKPLTRSFFARSVFDLWKFQIFAQKQPPTPKVGLLKDSTLTM